MKTSRVPDGDHALPCGASVRIADGRRLEVFFGPGRPTPSRGTVQREVAELTGLNSWLENWPEDRVLSAGVQWPGIAYQAVVLDYDDRVRAADDLLTLGALLSEIVELGLADDIGWATLGVDPTHLKNFGGERPSMPAGFFWRWGNGEEKGGLPPTPLSWDADHVLVAAEPMAGPYRISRTPSLLFSSDLARECGVSPCTDDEAFATLATVLPWSGTYEKIRGIDHVYVLLPHDRAGKEDPRGMCAIIRDRHSQLAQHSRDVVAVCPMETRKRADVVDSLRRWLSHGHGTRSRS